MTKVLYILVFLLLCCGEAFAQDGFEAVQCGSNIPAQLIGKHMSNERVVVTEARHKNLGLKDVGGEEVSDRLFLGFWMICGNEYVLLEDTRVDIIRDALAFPPHSKSSPEFSGQCAVEGKKQQDILFGVLDNQAGHTRRDALHNKLVLAAKFAWKIDEKNTRFVKVPTEGLFCSFDGIITADGGY